MSSEQLKETASRYISAREANNFAQIENNYIFDDEFEKGDELGSGAFGKVYLVKHISTELQCAVKIVEKDKIESMDEQYIGLMKQELEVLLMLDSMYITRILKLLESPDKIYIVMELAKHGQLEDFFYEKYPDNLTNNIILHIMK